MLQNRGEGSNPTFRHSYEYDRGRTRRLVNSEDSSSSSPTTANDPRQMSYRRVCTVAAGLANHTGVSVVRLGSRTGSKNDAPCFDKNGAPSDRPRRPPTDNMVARLFPLVLFVILLPNVLYYCVCVCVYILFIINFSFTFIVVVVVGGTGVKKSPTRL